MKFLATCLAAALIATSSMADDRAARTAAAESYLNSPAQQKMIDAMFAPDQMMGMLRMQIPDASEAQLNTMSRIISEELAAIRDRMEEVMLAAAVEDFTLEELQALDAFYRSPAGESVMLKMPGFMQTYMQEMTPDMTEMQRKIATRVRNEVLKQ